MSAPKQHQLIFNWENLSSKTHLSAAVIFIFTSMISAPNFEQFGKLLLCMVLSENAMRISSW